MHIVHYRPSATAMPWISNVIQYSYLESHSHNGMHTFIWRNSFTEIYQSVSYKIL